MDEQLKPKKTSNLFFAILVIIVGFGLLANNLGWISGILKYWPILIVLWGVKIIYDHASKE